MASPTIIDVTRDLAVPAPGLERVTHDENKLFFSPHLLPRTAGDTKDVQGKLAKIGWPIAVDGDYGPATHQAVYDFQRGYGRGGTRLTQDGIAGPATNSALDRCVAEGGKVSEHFNAREFACPHCHWICLHYSLPTALEVLRPRYYPSGLGILDGYRCLVHNAAIRGASNSQHLYGTAIDPDVQVATVPQIVNLRVFAGIEYRANHLVAHFDTRDQGGHNTTGNTSSNPSVFFWG